MNPKLKNAIIFIVIGIVIISVYFVFIKKAPDTANLAVTGSQGNASPVATTNTQTTTNNAGASAADSQLSKDFLAVLLSIKNINLDDSIFSSVAFSNLKDSTILLLPDGSEGRPNPFAPIGAENNVIPSSALPNLGSTTEVQSDSLFSAEVDALNTADPAKPLPPKTAPAPKKTTTPKP